MDDPPSWVRQHLRRGEQVLGWSDACPDEMHYRVMAEVVRTRGLRVKIAVAVGILNLLAGLLVLESASFGRPGEMVPMLFYLGMLGFILLEVSRRYIFRNMERASEAVEEGGFVMTNRRLFALDARLQTVAWEVASAPEAALADHAPNEVTVRFRNGTVVDVPGVEDPEALVRGVGAI